MMAPLPLPTPHSPLLPFCPFPPPLLSSPLLCIHAKSLQLCLTLCDPVDCSLPGSSIHGILQARITGVGCHALLQEIFPTQGLNPCLLRLQHWWVGSLPLAAPGKPCPPSIVPSYSARGLSGWRVHVIACLVPKLSACQCCANARSKPVWAQF